MTYNGHTLPKAESIKYLRLQSDIHLSWKNHIQMFVSNVEFKCLYYTLHTDSLKLLYFAHFHLRFNYSIIFLCTSGTLHKLLLIQKKILE